MRGLWKWGALSALICVVTVWLVNNEGSAASRWHDFCIHTEMKVPDWAIRDVVPVGHVPPQENTTVFDREFLDICHRHQHRRTWSFGSGSESRIRLVGHDFAWLRKIWLISRWVPFCGYPICGFSGWSTSEVFPSHADIGPRRKLTWLILVGTEMGNVDDLLITDIGPQLNTGSFNLFLDASIGLEKEIGAYARGDREYDSRSAQNARPMGYGLFIAFGIWTIAAACGAAGLLIGLFRQDSGLLYLCSLIVAGILGAVGSTFL
jgi:hypothetical protein